MMDHGYGWMSGGWMSGGWMGLWPVLITLLVVAMLALVLNNRTTK